jgi:uncharacterized membrane protein YecN with MAPEG domain
MLLALAYNVGARRRTQNALEPGATGDAMLMRAIRAHANFAEFAPMALLLLLALTWLDQSPLVLHIFGGGFTAGRVLHAIGMMRAKHPNAFRFIGNLITGLVLLGGGGLCVWGFVISTLP